MTARDPQACDVPVDEHSARVRFYANGWKCDTHAPWAVLGLDEPMPAPGPLPGVRATARERHRVSEQAPKPVSGHRPDAGMRVDPGHRDSRGKWIRIPTADYVCPTCGETESASGDQVAHFTTHIEADHAQRCTANPQGAPAA